MVEVGFCLALHEVFSLLSLGDPLPVSFAGSYAEVDEIGVHDLTFSVIDEFDGQRDISFFEDCVRKFVFKFKFVFVLLCSKQFFNNPIIRSPGYAKLR